MWEVEGMLFLEGEKLWSWISTLPLIQFQGHGATLEGTGSSAALSKTPGA